MGGRNPFSSTRRPLSLSNDRSGGSSPSRRPIEALLGRIRDSRMHSLVDLFQYPVQHPDALPGRAWDFRLGCWSVVYLLSTCFFDLFSVVREPTMSPPTSLKNLPESVSALLGMRSCRNHATTQVCAFPSPFFVSKSEIAIFRRLRINLPGHFTFIRSPGFQVLSKNALVGP